MKRSEILNKLIEEISLMRGVDSGFYVYPDDDQIASRLLGVIEEAGMAPPETNINEGSSEYGIPSVYVREWDQE